MMNDPNEDVVFLSGKIHVQFLESLNKIYNKFSPTTTIICFDRKSWRVEYTKSDKAITEKVYKAHRRQNLTPDEKERHDKFKESILEFEEIIRKHSSIICMSNEDLEADDIIGGVIDCFENEEIIIISSDKDYMQLLIRDNIRLIDPISGKDRRKELRDNYNNDPELFIFEKCIRGDRSDNVQSAYPGVRKTKIREAYVDFFKRTNLMHETWNLAGKQFVVGELFAENEQLMNLLLQPDHIRYKILNTVLNGLETQGKYNHFEFLKFLGSHGLKEISKSIERFIPMLSSKN